MNALLFLRFPVFKKVQVRNLIVPESSDNIHPVAFYFGSLKIADETNLQS